MCTYIYIYILYVCIYIYVYVSMCVSIYFLDIYIDRVYYGIVTLFKSPRLAAPFFRGTVGTVAFRVVQSFSTHFNANFIVRGL